MSSTTSPNSLGQADPPGKDGQALKEGEGKEERGGNPSWRKMKSTPEKQATCPLPGAFHANDKPETQTCTAIEGMEPAEPREKGRAMPDSGKDLWAKTHQW